MLNDGTYSVNRGGIVPIKTPGGFGISLPGHEEVWNTEPSWEGIGSYIARHADALSVPGTYLGVWRDDGKVYLDVTELHRITLEDALRIGAERNQKAVWDFGQNQERRI